MSASLPFFQEESGCASCLPDLTYQQRIIGFVSCTGVGMIISFIGTCVLFGGMSSSNVRTFAALYVIGNVIALMGTLFLVGPRAQCIKMWAPTRRFSTAFYLIMLCVVFGVAIARQNVFLVLFLLLVEIMAACWYTISYVPFGRKMVCASFRSTGICFPCFFCSDKYDEQWAAYEKRNAPTASEKMSNMSNSLFGASSSKESSDANGFFGGSKKEESGGFFGLSGSKA